MAHAVSADLTTLSRKIKKLVMVKHGQLVCVQWRQPARSSTDQPSCHVQGGRHSAFLKLWPGIRFEVSEAVIDGYQGGSLRQRQLGPNALKHLSDGQRVKPLSQQAIQVRCKLRARHCEGAEITRGRIAHRVVQQDRNSRIHAVRSSRRLCQRLRRNRQGPDASPFRCSRLSSWGYAGSSPAVAGRITSVPRCTTAGRWPRKTRAIRGLLSRHLVRWAPRPTPYP